MFLKSIQLKNVCCFRDAEISFETADGNIRKWTMLVGENGTGKSVVLRAIALLLAGSEALPELLHDPESWIRGGAKSCRISGVLTTARGQERPIGITIRRKQSIRKLLKECDESLKLLDDALEHTNRNYLTIGYGNSRRLSDPGQVGQHGGELFRHPRARSVTTLFAANAQLVPLESWAMELVQRKPDAGVALIKDAMQNLLPDVTFKALDAKSGRLVFETPDGAIPLRQLSDGYQSVIGYCGDLLHRITETFDDYRKPLEARGLLLIDELALHLHPVWQRRIVDFMTTKLPNLQLVATTNSPFTAQQSREGELHYLRRQPAGQSPSLQQFEGAPNKMLLHQLILSPLFGVPTVNSHGVECARSEYCELRDKSKTSKMSAKEKRRMDDLQAALSEVTTWDELSEADRELNALLGKIDEKLSAKV